MGNLHHTIELIEDESVTRIPVSLIPGDEAESVICQEGPHGCGSFRQSTQWRRETDPGNLHPLRNKRRCEKGMEACSEKEERHSNCHNVRILVTKKSVTEPSGCDMKLASSFAGGASGTRETKTLLKI